MIVGKSNVRKSLLFGRIEFGAFASQKIVVKSLDLLCYSELENFAAAPENLTIHERVDPLE